MGPMIAPFLTLLALSAPKDADRVLVIQNNASPASVSIASDYMARRGVKAVLKVNCQDSASETAKETMEFADFQTAIGEPLQDYLTAHPKIDFIVLTKGIPIRLINAPVGINGNLCSLDSYLASLGYASRKDTTKMTLNDSGFTGKCWFNRYWNSKERFSHAKFGGYLVTRLDGYTVGDAKSLTTSALDSEKTAPTGKILIDIASGHGLGDLKKVPISPQGQTKDGVTSLSEMNYNEWDADMMVAADQLQKAGLPVTLDNTEQFIGGQGNLMGYCSWGSNDPKFNPQNYLTLRFAPGGIAETAVSTSARTFLPTTGGQSLIADLIKAHVTGAKGYSDEPLLQAVASPTILFDRYTKGWTLAESYFAASRFVGWEDIVIGDPLCSPYARQR